MVLGTAACGPVGYLKQVHGKARAAVTEAKRAGAESAAPFEYVSAVEYLKKAQEEGDHAEYQVAIEYGRRAQTFAERARKIATTTTTDDGAKSSPPGVPPPGGGSP